MKSSTLIAALAVLLLAVLVWSALRFQRNMERGLPPKEECQTREAALAAALLNAGPGGAVKAVLATGSMAPYIRGARKGEVPLETVVAYAVVKNGATFEDIKAFDLVLYRATWIPDPNNCVMHQAAMKDWLGWIMSGLHNKLSESGDRVTKANFKGIVAKTYVWK